MSELPKPFTTRVHYYESPTRFSTAYEDGAENTPNAIIAIGGLSDGPHTVPALRKIAARLDGSQGGPAYSMFEIRMKSSFIGFGTSSLADDVVHISCLVKYLRDIGKKTIVLMGHSTGCQDIIEYVDYEKHKSEAVDGFIMQGPVSDRQGIETFGDMFPDDDFPASLECARKMVAEGRKDDCLPWDKTPKVFAGTPMSAYRLLSLGEKGGDDDYFSTDLDADFVSKVWSRFDKPVMALHSNEDEFVPSHVDKKALIDSWMKVGKQVSPLSGVIPGANHCLDAPEAQEWFANRVAEFLATLPKATDT